MSYLLGCGCSEKQHFLNDDGIILSCKEHPNLLSLKLNEQHTFETLFKNSLTQDLSLFSNILPINEKNPDMNILKSQEIPAIIKDKHFAKKLGLNNVYYSICGFSPSHKISNLTGTFKILESASVYTRHVSYGLKNIPIVIASEGNTANAFAKIAIEFDLKLVIVTPHHSLNRLFYAMPDNKNIDLVNKIVRKNILFIVTPPDFDYSDSIKLSEQVSGIPGFQKEGGAKNIARRYGMGLVMASYFHKLKEFPDHYFQAVGSGTGIIAQENVRQTIAETLNHKLKPISYHFSQNYPFIPMVNAWNAKRREIIEKFDMPDPKEAIAQIKAAMLSNRTPAYGIGGGLYDTLISNRGFAYYVENSEITQIQKEFSTTEEIDIGPHSAVAVNSLIKACRSQKIKKYDRILVNLTDVGVEKIKKEKKIIYFSNLTEKNKMFINTVSQKEIDTITSFFYP